MMTTKPVDYNSLTLRGCGGGGHTYDCIAAKLLD